MTTPPEDEFTELVDATIPRIDLVDKAANGTRFILAKRTDGVPGLLDPAFVRGLIGKSAPEPTQEETVTMTGSPAAIAKLIHEAAQRTTDPVAKADLSTADLNDLPDSAFAYIEPGGHKDSEGKTVPRSLRHFAINDEAHVRNALSRAPQSPFGDKAMPKIRAAAKKFGIEVSKAMEDDALDATTALAEPEGDAPGMDTDPGSPAWEAVDAATARKWTAILARAKAAIDLLADREMLEAAAGADEDAEQAMDLQDACCAIDYAISILAPFAVAEQAEADCAEEMAAVGKALHGFDPDALDTIEALGHVRKAGRVLSASNEAAIRGAVESLQKVLASLPDAPTTGTGGQVAKADAHAEEETDMPTPETSDQTVAEHGEQPKMGIAKADGEAKAAMRAVYDAKGRLVGIVDPADITPIEDAAPEPDGDEDVPESTTDTSDQEPAPAAQVGTPADAVADGVTKTSTSGTTDNLTGSISDLIKAAFAEQSATLQQILTKQAEDLKNVTDTVEGLRDQVTKLEEQPAEPRVFTRGAGPTPQQLRGHDQGAAQVDTARAQELRKGLYADTAAERDKAAIDMQKLAIAQLEQIHSQRR